MPFPDRLPLSSVSPNAERIAELRRLFPEAFVEGKVDFDRLKQSLGEVITTDRERYGLSWAGKSDAVHVLQSLSVGTLKPMREESVEFDRTENLIIEGDNLEVLKLLQKSYFGKVKMIYIDPPYNTGNEFIYPDNYREGLEDYLRYSGQVSESGAATTSNTETSGRYHSKWLSMMYPRLFLARNLLRDDGVIFVSIDDHEVHNLRLLMNEIFGEENFVANVVWRRTVSRAVSGNGIAVSHDHIICFGKTTDASIGRLGVQDETQYKNPDDDPRGPYKLQKLERTLEGSRPSMTFSINSPNGEIKRTWSVSPKRFAEMLDDNRIVFNKTGMPYYKQFLGEFEGIMPDTWWDKEGGYNQEGARELKLLFGINDAFSSPKPSALVKRMAQITTMGGGIILDFFAGSGTAAQAVLELNAEDGGNRKFILVQLPEKTENPQFPTIADITRERVRRVIARMNEADAAKLLDVTDTAAQDRGFKAFRLAASNFQIWDGTEAGTDTEALTQQLELFADNLLPDATPEDILFEILLKSGYDLNAPRQELTLANHRVYSVAGGELLLCLECTVTRAVIDALLAQNPKPRAVFCLDEAFHSDDALLTNTHLQMQDAEIMFQTV